MTRIRRFRSFAAAGLAATLLLAACGDETLEPAAVVNGLEISQQDVVDELDAIEGNTTYYEAYEAQAVQTGEAPAIAGSEDDTFNTAFVATTLSTRILYALIEAEVERRGIEIDAECREQAATLAADRVAGASPEGDGEAVLDEFGPAYRDYLIDREADVLALQADLAGQPCVDDGSAVRRYFDEHPELFAIETACVSHILVDTEAEADEIADLLDEGADFAELAAERSTDTGSAANGGDVGCNPSGAFVPEFDTAAFTQPVGEVSDPVQTEFGFHLILVTSRGLPEFEDIEPQVADALSQEVNAAFGEWFEPALAEAEVTLDQRYGTWDPAGGTITRPAPGDDPDGEPTDQPVPETVPDEG